MIESPLTKMPSAEALILRRDLAAVNSLLRKGLLAAVGGRVVVTDSGQAVLDEHKKAVSEKRSKAGRSGGPARAESLSPKRRSTIAKGAAAARFEKGGPKS